LNPQRFHILEVRGRPDGHDAFGLPRRREVDAADGGVGEVASKKYEVQASGGLQVVNKAPGATDQVGIFDAAN
jgi:hypothetical protein